MMKVLKIAPPADGGHQYHWQGETSNSLLLNMAITIESGSKDRKNFLTLYSHPLSFNVNSEICIFNALVLALASLLQDACLDQILETVIHRWDGRAHRS